MSLVNALTGAVSNSLWSLLPAVWLGLSAAGMIALASMSPVLFGRFWKPLAGIAVAGFVALLVVQHFHEFNDRKRQIDDLKVQLATAEESVTNLQTSIDNHQQALDNLERSQRAIRKEIKAARVGLDSTTAFKEADRDPVKAASDLSDRYNRFNRMFDAATESFGTASSTSGTGSDPDKDR